MAQSCTLKVRGSLLGHNLSLFHLFIPSIQKQFLTKPCQIQGRPR